MALAALVALALLGTLAGFSYASRHNRPDAIVTAISCNWRGSYLRASGTIYNFGSGASRFGVTVSYTLARHGKQADLSAGIPADGHSSAAFAWGERGTFPGEQITHCSASAVREPSGD